MPKAKMIDGQLPVTQEEKQSPRWARSVYKNLPPPPPEYDPFDIEIWRATCARVLSELDQIFASDLEMVHRYVQINRTLRKLSVDSDRIEESIVNTADPKDLVYLLKAIAELRKQDMFYSNLQRQTFRAIETTVNERHRRLKEKQKQHGGQPGTRQRPARAGVPSNQKAGGPVSWVEKARKKGGD